MKSFSNFLEEGREQLTPFVFCLENKVEYI